MKILHVAAEMFPLLKTGGLADVIGALPFAQQQLPYAEVRVLLPAYPALSAAIPDTPIVAEIDTFAGNISLRYGQYKGLGIYLIDAPHLFNREGNPYHDDNYHDYADNFLRFALLGYVGAELADGLDGWWKPDVVHAHDWHAGLTCAYMKQNNCPVKSLFTVHNIAYQGQFDARHLQEINLPDSLFAIEGMEFHGQISYLKAGIYYADHVTTVSPSFAKEMTTESGGFGLHGLLQTIAKQGRLSGVLNGVDDTVWNPKDDENLAARYRLGVMQGKAKNKAALQREFGLPVDKTRPLFVIVSRLTAQKGLDYCLDSLSGLLKKKAQLVVLGNGEPELETALQALVAKHPKQVGIHIGYDEPLAHRVIAGGDVIIIPSRFEPCGLTQLYGLKYGTLPLVRRTGGLADTVTHTDDDSIKAKTATGFVFEEADAKALSTALQQVLALWKTPRKWNQVRANAMRENFNWQLAAEKYYNLYMND